MKQKDCWSSYHTLPRWNDDNKNKALVLSLSKSLDGSLSHFPINIGSFGLGGDKHFNLHYCAPGEGTFCFWTAAAISLTVCEWQNLNIGKFTTG